MRIYALLAAALALPWCAAAAAGGADEPSTAATPTVPQPQAGENADVAKERAEIPDPPYVDHAGVRYQAVPWGKARGLKQNGGYLAAVDTATGAEMWLLKVYDVSYDRDMEGDKLDLFITDLALDPDGSTLRVDNERGESYRVNLKTRRVVGPLATTP
jgi:hypothetical protein